MRRGASSIQQISVKLGVARTITVDNIETPLRWVPRAVEAQMQGGLIHGVYSVLHTRATLVKGVPQVQSFSNYRVLTLRHMPKVTVDILQGDPATAMPGGIGEAGVPCVAPALAAAWHRMSGTRVYELPYHPGATMSDN